MSAQLTPDAAHFLARIPRSVHELTVDQARAFAAALPQIVGPGPDVARVRHRGEVRIYEPSDRTQATVVYLHGGGWVVGGAANDDALARALAVATDCRVVSVDYRLAPEHPFPAALDDVRNVIAAYADEPLVLVGESAGGNLAAAVADAGSIAGLVLVCPVVDHERVDASRDTALLSAADLDWFWSHYVPDPARRSDPLASPGRRDDLASLPPTLLVTAEHDPLAPQGREFAERLRLAGVDVRHDHREDLMHGFLPLLGVVAGAQQVVDDIGAFVRSVVIAEVLA